MDHNAYTKRTNYLLIWYASSITVGPCCPINASLSPVKRTIFRISNTAARPSLAEQPWNILAFKSWSKTLWHISQCDSDDKILHLNCQMTINYAIKLSNDTKQCSRTATESTVASRIYIGLMIIWANNNQKKSGIILFTHKKLLVHGREIVRLQTDRSSQLRWTRVISGWHFCLYR